jgi:hypothetical protein
MAPCKKNLSLVIVSFCLSLLSVVFYTLIWREFGWKFSSPIFALQPFEFHAAFFLPLEIFVSFGITIIFIEEYFMGRDERFYIKRVIFMLQSGSLIGLLILLQMMYMFRDLFIGVPALACICGLLYYAMRVTFFILGDRSKKSVSQ